MTDSPTTSPAESTADDADQPDVLEEGGSFGAPAVGEPSGTGTDGSDAGSGSASGTDGSDAGSASASDTDGSDAGSGSASDTGVDERGGADLPGGRDERGEKSPLDPDHESFAAREAHGVGSGPNGSSTSSPDGIGAYSDGPDADAEPADAHADSPDPDADGVA